MKSAAEFVVSAVKRILFGPGGRTVHACADCRPEKSRGRFPNALRLEDGCTLRLLTAMEVLEARREAEKLSRDERERALCSNACLLARALEKRERPVFRDGEAVLDALRVEEIAELAARWGAFNREENPSVLDGESVVSALKKAWSTRRMSG